MTLTRKFRERVAQRVRLIDANRHPSRAEKWERGRLIRWLYDNGGLPEGIGQDHPSVRTWSALPSGEPSTKTDEVQP